MAFLVLLFRQFGKRRDRASLYPTLLLSLAHSKEAEDEEVLNKAGSRHHEGQTQDLEGHRHSNDQERTKAEGSERTLEDPVWEVEEIT